MKTKRHIVAIAAAITMTSCASFSGGYSADTDHNGIVSKAELIRHQQRIRAGNSEMDFEAHRFQHFNDMLESGRGIMNTVRSY